MAAARKARVLEILTEKITANQLTELKENCRFHHHAIKVEDSQRRIYVSYKPDQDKFFIETISCGACLTHIFRIPFDELVAKVDQAPTLYDPDTEDDDWDPTDSRNWVHHQAEKKKQ